MLRKPEKTTPYFGKMVSIVISEGSGEENAADIRFGRPVEWSLNSASVPRW